MNDQKCEGCDLSGFPDMIIPFSYWVEISPYGDDRGLLCPSCICRRLHERGLSCPGAFVSGPVRSVTQDTITLMRQFENLELALRGRTNGYHEQIENLVRGVVESDLRKGRRGGS